MLSHFGAGQSARDALVSHVPDANRAVDTVGVRDTRMPGRRPAEKGFRTDNVLIGDKSLFRMR